MFRHVAALLLISLASLSTGCSVAMSAASTQDPASALAVGATRPEVEKSLKSPIHSEPRTGGGRVDQYAYAGPDSDGSLRAFQNGVMDAITLGIWEAFATPDEHQMSKRRPTCIAVVEYDAEDRVVAWRIERPGQPESPSPGEHNVGEQGGTK